MERDYNVAREGGLDLWDLYDSPHVEDVKNPLVFAAFMRSGSTRTVASSSMFNTVAFRATGPDGGKVTFHAVKSYLEPEAYEVLIQAYEEAKSSGRVIPAGRRLREIA